MTALKRTLAVLDGDDGTLMKVAFASTDRVYVNQHFGASLAFVIYGVSLSDIKLLVISEFHDPLGVVRSVAVDCPQLHNHLSCKRVFHHQHRLICQCFTHIVLRLLRLLG